jgi:hypothetical protein
MQQGLTRFQDKKRERETAQRTQQRVENHDNSSFLSSTAQKPVIFDPRVSYYTTLLRDNDTNNNDSGGEASRGLQRKPVLSYGVHAGKDALSHAINPAFAAQARKEQAGALLDGMEECDSGKNVAATLS